MNKPSTDSPRFDTAEPGADTLLKSAELLDQLIVFAREQGDTQFLEMALQLESVGWSALDPEQLELLMAQFRQQHQRMTAAGDNAEYFAQATPTATDTPAEPVSDAAPVGATPRAGKEPPCAG